MISDEDIIRRLADGEDPWKIDPEHGCANPLTGYFPAQEVEAEKERRARLLSNPMEYDGKTGTLESAKVIIEVTAGVIPGTPEPQFTRRWAITSREWEEAQQKDMMEDGIFHPMAELLVLRAAQADAYAMMLRDPSRINWTRTDWIWL